MTPRPFGFLFVEFLWHFRLLKAAACPLLSSTCYFPTAAPLHSTSPIMCFWQTYEPEIIYSATGMCSLCGNNPPERTVWGRVNTLLTKSSWPTLMTYGVGCVFSHAPTADLWLANGNKVPTNIISSQGHTQELNKEQKERRWKKWVRTGVKQVGLGARGPKLQKTRGQFTLQAPLHTYTPAS